MTTDKYNNPMSVGGIKAALRALGHPDYLVELPGGDLVAFVPEDHPVARTVGLGKDLDNLRPAGVVARVKYLSSLNVVVSVAIRLAVTAARADGRRIGHAEGHSEGYEKGFADGAAHARLRNRTWRKVASVLDKWRCRRD